MCKMKVWITKYAFTTGIIEEELEHTDESMVKCGQYNFYHKGEWFRTKAEAKEKVLEMIAKKRVTISNQLVKLDKLAAKLHNL